MRLSLPMFTVVGACLISAFAAPLDSPETPASDIVGSSGGWGGAPGWKAKRDDSPPTVDGTEGAWGRMAGWKRDGDDAPTVSGTEGNWGRMAAWRKEKRAGEEEVPVIMPGWGSRPGWKRSEEDEEEEVPVIMPGWGSRPGWKRSEEEGEVESDALDAQDVGPCCRGQPGWKEKAKRNASTDSTDEGKPDVVEDTYGAWGRQSGWKKAVKRQENASTEPAQPEETPAAVGGTEGNWGRNAAW